MFETARNPVSYTHLDVYKRQLYMIDDIKFKRDFKTINGSLPQVLRFVLSHTGMNAGLSERFRALVHIFQNGGEIEQELMDTRCDRGAEIARKMHFSESVIDAIRSLDEHWNGGGMPRKLSGAQIPVYSRIALISQVVDVFQTAKDVYKRQVETWFLQNGFRGLAQIVRQARLSTWHDDPVMRQLQLIQSRFNFPILLLSSILLARFLAANKIQNVLFCSRDCNLWIDLFRAVRQQIGVETGESYFYTSRLARMKSSPSYRRYAEQALKGGSLLVDVCGTGWSLSHMLRGLGVQTPVFFIHHLPKTDVYEQMRPTPERCV